MNNADKKDIGISDDYSWNGVIEFLINQCRKGQLKETESLLEKKEMEEKINELSSSLKAQEALNEELMKRVKMLEYCLRQERLKFSAALSKSSPNEKKEILRELER
jgi:striatin 1/3/4